MTKVLSIILIICVIAGGGWYYKNNIKTPSEGAPIASAATSGFTLSSSDNGPAADKSYHTVTYKLIAPPTLWENARYVPRLRIVCPYGGGVIAQIGTDTTDICGNVIPVTAFTKSASIKDQYNLIVKYRNESGSPKTVSAVGFQMDQGYDDFGKVDHTISPTNTDIKDIQIIITKKNVNIESGSRGIVANFYAGIRTNKGVIDVFNTKANVVLKDADTGKVITTISVGAFMLSGGSNYNSYNDTDVVFKPFFEWAVIPKGTTNVSASIQSISYKDPLPTNQYAQYTNNLDLFNTGILNLTTPTVTTPTVTTPTVTRPTVTTPTVTRPTVTTPTVTTNPTVTNTATTKYPTFTRTLWYGSRGADVANLKSILSLKGFAPSSTHDYFDGSTATNLAKYQSSVGIFPSVGYFGSKTRNHFNSLGL
jgi:hypothetical protein